MTPDGNALGSEDGQPDTRNDVVADVHRDGIMQVFQLLGSPEAYIGQKRGSQFTVDG
jgi:hypothetical protein